MTATLPIVALSPTSVVFVITFAVNTEFAILVIVAESVNCWSAFIVPVAIVEIVAESIKAESAFINPVDSCLTCPESKVNLSMFAESTSKSPIATLLKNALSPEEITKLVAARLPIVAESKVAF